MNAAYVLEEEEQKLELVAKRKNSAKGYNGYRKTSPVYGETDPEKRQLQKLPHIGDIVELWDYEMYERGKHKTTDDGQAVFTHLYKVPYDGCKKGSIVKRFKVVGYTNSMRNNKEIASCKIHFECVYPEECVPGTPMYIPALWVIYRVLEVSKVEKMGPY